MVSFFNSSCALSPVGIAPHAMRVRRWHMALNLELCVAVTHNFVSRHNVGDVLCFLRDRQALVCAPTVATRVDGTFRRVASTEMPADKLHYAFRDALRRERPDLDGSEAKKSEGVNSEDAKSTWALAAAKGSDPAFSFGF